jgi:hypothetical protein
MLASMEQPRKPHKEATDDGAGLDRIVTGLALLATVALIALSVLS